MAVNPTIAELEQKYIELLEKKVARLESEKGSEKSSEKSSKDGKPATLVSQRRFTTEIINQLIEWL